MSTDLAERLLSWAQNEEMIDTHYTGHGLDCISAHDELKRLKAAHDHQYAVAGTLLREAEAAQREVERLREKLTLQEMGARSLVDILENEIEQLRGWLQTCMDRWIPFREVELRRQIDEAISKGDGR